jgi:NAD(P)-dependent dehydrogenase (short-subunit alcohol dehydrogenase family)
MTNSRGVDVVLNSLSGEALRKTWECIAAFGRFVDVGKRDIFGNTGLEMSPFLHNVTFAGVNLEYMLQNNRKAMTRVLQAIFGLIRSGSVGGIKPLTVYPFSNMEEAFRTMHQAKHTGKIVLSVNVDDHVPVVPRELHPVRLSEDATYMIVGGLGGIGRSLVLQLAKYGCKHVAFLSRSGATKSEAQATLAELEGLGINATSYICDVADEVSFQATVKKIQMEKPPIKGAIHAAMVLNDTLFEAMSYRQWSETTRNKVAGGWNMHRFLPEDLDFFVMLSSASGYMGSSTLSNYASGNTFLDALAQHRRSKGLTACALGLGFISGIGWAMENIKVTDEHKADYDLMSIQPAHVFSLVESAISGYAYGDRKMPPQLPTTMGTGGELQHTKFIKTRYYYSDPRFAYVRRLDVRDELGRSVQSETTTLMNDLRKVSSLMEAVERIEGALAMKLATSMSMKVEDVDTSKPVSSYGVDSLVSMEIGNWIHAVLRSNVGVFDILRAAPMSQLALKIAENCALVPESIRNEGGQS